MLKRVFSSLFYQEQNPLPYHQVSRLLVTMRSLGVPVWPQLTYRQVSRLLVTPRFLGAKVWPQSTSRQVSRLLATLRSLGVPVWPLSTYHQMPRLLVTMRSLGVTAWPQSTYHQVSRLLVTMRSLSAKISMPPQNQKSAEDLKTGEFSEDFHPIPPSQRNNPPRIIPLSFLPQIHIGTFAAWASNLPNNKSLKNVRNMSRPSTTLWLWLIAVW